MVASAPKRVMAEMSTFERSPHSQRTWPPICHHSVAAERRPPHSTHPWLHPATTSGISPPSSRALRTPKWPRPRPPPPPSTTPTARPATILATRPKSFASFRTQWNSLGAQPCVGAGLAANHLELRFGGGALRSCTKTIDFFARKFRAAVQSSPLQSARCHGRRARSICYHESNIGLRES